MILETRRLQMKVVKEERLCSEDRQKERAVRVDQMECWVLLRPRKPNKTPMVVLWATDNTGEVQERARARARAKE